MPVIGDSVMPARVNPSACAAADDFVHDPLPGRPVVADDAALADLVAPGLELRLDQRDDVAAGREQRRHDRQDRAQRDERDVDRDDAEAAGVGRAAASGCSVRAFMPLEHDDPRIAAQRQSSWPWPTSSATTRAAPRWSRTSVKPPVDAPMSSASRPSTSMPKRVERVRQLEPAAADVRMVGRRAA